MIRFDWKTALIAAALLARNTPASAQFLELIEGGTPGPGWTFVPSVAMGLDFDNNAYTQSTIDSPSSDLVARVSPAGAIDFSGRRSNFSVAYAGGFTRYQTFDELNYYEHTGNISFSRQLSRHTTFSVGQSATLSPSTETQTLVGVPFVRLGSRMANFNAGIDSAVSKRTTINASYNFQFVDFDEDPTALGRPLIGGHNQGVNVGVRRRLTARLSGSGTYGIQWASVISGDGFSMQNASGGIDYRLSDISSIFTNVGVSRVVSLDRGQRSLLPIWRAGISRNFERVDLEAIYGRDFVPSYAGGGTQQNQELTVRAGLKLWRRISTNTSLMWRRDSVIDSLSFGRELPLTSVWLNGSLGYALRRWAQMEAFYSGLAQTIDRPGGDVNRYRLGVQVSMSAPMRMK